MHFFFSSFLFQLTGPPNKYKHTHYIQWQEQQQPTASLLKSEILKYLKVQNVMKPPRNVCRISILNKTGLLQPNMQ